MGSISPRSRGAAPKKAAEQPTGIAPSLPVWSLGNPPPYPPVEGPPPPPGPPGLGNLFSSIFPLGARTPPPEVSAEPRKLYGIGQLPERPALLYELGNGFLDTGPLSQGFEMPGGAIWQPRFYVFGTYRTALQGLANGTAPHVSEWANRLDLFGNLQLTGTERLVVGLRPLDRDLSGDFAGWRIGPVNGRGGRRFFNANVNTLFFEGDLGSTLPNLDRLGVLPIDFGYTIGRQPLSYQNGMLINDTIDMAGITRNSIHLPNSSNAQISFYYAENHIRRPNRPDTALGKPNLWGIATTTDLFETTYDIDFIRENDSNFGDTSYAGLGVIKRIGLLNTALRFNGSLPDRRQNAVSTKGGLVSLETSFVVFGSEDIVYLDPYVAIGNFTQAAKDPIAAGPLGGLGITYSAFGIGTAISALNSAARDVAGFATGYQAFWDNHRRSLTLEFGTREQLRDHTFGAQAIGARFQQAFGQRLVLELDTSFTHQEAHHNAWILRTEWAYQF